jgi:ribosome-binding protein aMBF1 (putative translation factor)
MPPGIAKMKVMLKPIARYLEESGMSVADLAQASKLDTKLVAMIVNGNFTPSPSQRQSLAAALGLSTEEISWEHSVPVDHLRGNGPQCGRST